MKSPAETQQQPVSRTMFSTRRALTRNGNGEATEELKMSGFYIPLAANELPPSATADQDEDTVPAPARQ
jgi:hypothetical protein